MQRLLWLGIGAFVALAVGNAIAYLWRQHEDAWLAGYREAKAYYGDEDI